MWRSAPKRGLLSRTGPDSIRWRCFAPLGRNSMQWYWGLVSELETRHYQNTDRFLANVPP